MNSNSKACQLIALGIPMGDSAKGAYGQPLPLGNEAGLQQHASAQPNLAYTGGKPPLASCCQPAGLSACTCPCTKVDYQGTVNLVALARQKGIKHVVLVTSIGTDDFLNPLNLYGGAFQPGFATTPENQCRATP